MGRYQKKFNEETKKIFKEDITFEDLNGIRINLFSTGENVKIVSRKFDLTFTKKDALIVAKAIEKLAK